MPFTAKTLADGQLSNTTADLYTVPVATKTYVKRLSLFNTNSTQQTIFVYVKRSGGSDRVWRRYVLEQNESADVLEEGDSLLLSAGDKLRAVTTTASSVDWFMSGVEET